MKKDFAFIDAQRQSAHLIRRNGEVKVGEKITFASGSIEESLRSFKGQYVLLGIEEDIGPRANGGFGGAMSAFKAFLSRFLNMQANQFMNTDNLMILGRAKFECVETEFESLRQAVGEMDEFLTEIIAKIYTYNKVPVVVGGGHNNAYPLMKAYFQTVGKTLDVVNLDPHADFRSMEGRHSGNSFSYAKHEGYLNSYTVHGLHKQYNSQEMLLRMEKEGVIFSCFEHYLDGERVLWSDAGEYAAIHKEGYGVELDLDSIENMPSSAMTPVGWSLFDTRRWLRQLAKRNPVYFNFTEGAPDLDSNGNYKVGKALAYFVSDLIEK